MNRLVGVVGLGWTLLVGAASVGRVGAADTGRYAVPEAIASDCSVDVTPALQGWFATVPDGSVIRFAAGGCYRIDGTLELENRRDLTFGGNGATFRAGVTGAAHRAQWRFIAGRGIVIRDMTIVGANDAGGTPSAFNEELQHQHAIDMRGVTGLKVSNVAVRNVYGDCFYIGPGDDWAWSRDVAITGSTCSKSGRMGVAVTAGRNVAVTGSTFDLVGLTSITVEPNGGSTGGRDLMIKNNIIGDSGHWTFAVVGYSGGGYIDNITVSGNTILDRSMTMTIDHAGNGPRPSRITITDNSGAQPEWFNHSRGVIDVVGADAVTIVNNSQVAAGSDQWFVYARDSCATVHSNTFAGGSGEFDNEHPTC